jgi:hypothetical protein
MAPSALRAEHPDGAGDDACEPERDMNSHDYSEKHRIGGGNLDP